MKALVKITAQATPYWATVEIPQGEIQENLQLEWEKLKGLFSKRVSSKGCPYTQSLAEEEVGIFNLYKNFWKQRLWEMVEKQEKLHLNETNRLVRDVCFITEVTVAKEGDRYVIRGVVFFEPSIRWKKDRKFNSSVPEELYKVTIPAPSMIPNEVVNRTIKEIANQIRYGTQNLIPLVDGKPLVEGDVCKINSVNFMKKALGDNKPRESVVVLGGNCPTYIKEALIGKSVGDDVVMTEVLNEPDGSSRKMQVRSKILMKCDAPPVSNEVLCRNIGVTSVDEIPMKIRMQLSKREESTFYERLLMVAMMNCDCGPVPGVAVWDRAEGALEFMAKESGMSQEELICKMGASSWEEAVSSMLPVIRRDMVREFISKKVAGEIGLFVSDRMSYERAKTMNMNPDDPQILYLVKLDLYSKIVLSHYEKRARETASDNEKRVVIPGQNRTSGHVVLP